MIETLISSKTRIKLLLKFFLNSQSKAYLRSLESEFGESTNSIRLELNRLEKAGMLSSYASGNKKFYTADTKHPLFREIHNIVKKHLGFDTIIEKVIERLGDVDQVFVTGSLAKGIDSNIIDLMLIGDINKEFLIRLIDKAEEVISRKIRYVVYSAEEKLVIDWSTFDIEPLLIWSSNE